MNDEKAGTMSDNDEKPNKDDNNESEYLTLRQEILDAMKGGANVLNLALTATTVIIGYSLSLKDPEVFLFFAPILILSVAIIQISQSHLGVIQNATYIRLILEKSTDKRWESWMSAYRSMKVEKFKDDNNLKKLNKILRLNFITRYYTLRYHTWACMLVGFVCFIYALVYGLRKYGNSIKNFPNESYVFDWEAFLFASAFLILLIWWIWISIQTHQTMQPSHVRKCEREYESDLKIWLTCPINFDYKNYEISIDENALRSQLKPFYSDIVNNSVEFTIVYVAGSIQIQVKNAPKIIFENIKKDIETKFSNYKVESI